MTDYPSAPEQDVAVLSRIRLARNYEDFPFSPVIGAEETELITQRVWTSVEMNGQADAFHFHHLSKMPEDEQGRLLDRFQISNDLLKYRDNAAVMLSKGETISIMVGEEDHLRIFGLMPGLQLEIAADLAYKADSWLEKGSPFAFDNQFGYLTTSPSNAGSGMRGLILMHLPTLRAAGQITRVSQEVAKLGLTLRGQYSEGNEADGNLYQLTSNAALGRPEEDVIRSLIAAATQIIEVERGVREKMLEQDELSVTDRLFRSIGILRNARLMSDKEWMQRWSDLRLAAVIGLIDGSIAEIDRLMMDLQPHSLNASVGKSLSERERGTLRADILRSKMTEMPNALVEI
ncbi:MAG: ATP--guanido phosphotransferase [Clostridia bacterium]|nr:ATP--guanido phosphotransferase [Clostridia bacterium]